MADPTKLEMSVGAGSHGVYIAMLSFHFDPNNLQIKIQLDENLPLFVGLEINPKLNHKKTGYINNQITLKLIKIRSIISI